MNLAGAPASGIADHGGADHRCAARGATPRPHREHCRKSGAPSVNRVWRQTGANSVRSPRVAGRFPVRCPASPTACPSHEEWRLAERQPPSLALKGSPRGSRAAPEASLRFIRAQTAGGGTRAAFGRRSIPAEPPPNRENWRLAALIVAFPSEYSRYSSRFAPCQPGAAPTGRNAHARVLPPTPPA